MKKALPPIVLFLLAPVVSGLLTRRALPVEFYSPLGLLALILLYGGGALLIREAVLRWGKGWYSILVLGAAYGIVQEGLMVKSFFDPLWPGIGILGYYGRWAGINWIWSFELTVYHAVISIAIPILLTELIFPGRRREKWLPTWLLTLVAVYFTFNIVFGSMFLTEYSPHILHYIIAAIVAISLVLIAWRLPRRPFPARDVSVGKPVWFWLLGFAAMVIFMVIFWILPDFFVLPLVTAVLGFMLVGGCFWLLMRLTGNGAAWRDIHKLALVSGPLTIFIFMTPLQEFRVNRIDDTTGTTIVGIIMLLFLIWLFWKTLKRREVKEDE